jgi:hypothetical protein
MGTFCALVNYVNCLDSVLSTIFHVIQESFYDLGRNSKLYVMHSHLLKVYHDCLLLTRSVNNTACQVREVA